MPVVLSRRVRDQILWGMRFCEVSWRRSEGVESWERVVKGARPRMEPLLESVCAEDLAGWQMGRVRRVPGESLWRWMRSVAVVQSRWTRMLLGSG